MSSTAQRILIALFLFAIARALGAAEGAIGTATFRWLDESRPLSVAHPERSRELNVQIWYRSRNVTGDLAGYTTIIDAITARKYLQLDEKGIDEWKNLKTRSRIRDLAEDPDRARPLLLISHGLGVSLSNYTLFAEELAAQGYVVAAIDHPFGGFTVLSDGTIATEEEHYRDMWSSHGLIETRIAEWVADLDYVAGKLQLGAAVDLGIRIDASRIGVLGHSMGGAAALEACQTSLLISACVVLDSPPRGMLSKSRSITRDVLVLRSRIEWGKAPDRESSAWLSYVRTRAWINGTWVPVLSMDRDQRIMMIDVIGATHLSFSDVPVVAPARLDEEAPPELRSPGTQVMKAIMLLVHAFFDHKLLGKEERITAIVDERDDLKVLSLR